MKSETLKALKLFNEKAKKLEESTFANQLIGSSLEIKWNTNIGFSTKRIGPKGESIDAYILTYRYFIQDKEKSSFRNLSESYKDSSISDESRNKFEEIRTELNRFLDSHTNIIINGENLTNRKIQDVFIYGGYAHAEEEKKEIFDKWMSRAPLNAKLEHQFICILGKILYVIKYVKNLNEEIISKNSKLFK